MEVKQNATLTVKKGENLHVYHVPPTASAAEVYEALKEMLAHVFGILGNDFKATPEAPSAPVAEPAPTEAVAEVAAQPA